MPNYKKITDIKGLVLTQSPGTWLRELYFRKFGNMLHQEVSRKAGFEINSNALDLLSRMVEYDPERRITAEVRVLSYQVNRNLSRA